MMPKTSVSPAASKNSKRPNCRPLRHCSMNSVIAAQLSCHCGGAAKGGAPGMTYLIVHPSPQANGGSACAPPPSFAPGSLHRALTVEGILVVLDDRGDGLEYELAFGVLDHVLEIEGLDREVVVAELEVAAHRLEVGFFQRFLQRIFIRDVALGGVERRGD